MEDIRRAKDERGNEAVQQQRTRKVAAKIVAVGVVVAAELEVSGYGTLLTFESAE
jgi:outer membrane protein OmpA-like peptidoglycan-associated protein